MTTVDGRTARRHRNTDAVLDAAHELFVEGHLEPTVEDVATRSGVSLRSVYRYFPDRDQLLQAALIRRMGVAEHLYEFPGLGEGGFEERVASYVAHVLALHDAIAPTGRAALQAAPSLPAIARAVQQRRDQHVGQVRRHFAAELDRLPTADAEEALAALEVLGQFSSLETLRVDRGLSVDAAARVLARGVRALLDVS